MKKIFYIIAVLVVWTSCTRLDDVLSRNPYGEGIRRVNIQLTYPEVYADELKAGVVVTIQKPDTKTEWQVKTDEHGFVSVELQYGIYRIGVSDKGTPVSGAVPIFNRNIDQLKITDESSDDIDLNVDLKVSYAGQLIIKELYYRGCTRSADNKTNQYDKYVVIYNNSDQTAYLDSVCFGCVGSNYNATTTPTKWVNKATGAIMDTIPISSAVWQFPSSLGNPGKTFPLEPGEEAVVSLCAAIDHTLEWPASVNLNVAGYWVCYDSRYYTNATYHPAPGPNLAGHYLSVLKKIDSATAYAFSVSSPAAVIFRIPADVSSAYEYVNNPDNLKREPGATTGNFYAMIPGEWVLDGLECFDASNKCKRCPDIVDAGYALLEVSYQGKTVHRKIDQTASAEVSARLGRPITIYQDTNNSSADFYVKDIQSIKQ